MLSAAEIAAAKKKISYGNKEALHEHDDCVRIAYEWLDAQTTTKGINRLARPLKHMVEKWGGRYVSQSDVEVAAELHPKIRGTYPYFNISARLIQPSDVRLANIGEAKTQDYKLSERTAKETYAKTE
jgi:hypothetical protein